MRAQAREETDEVVDWQRSAADAGAVHFSLRRSDRSAAGYFGKSQAPFFMSAYLVE